MLGTGVVTVNRVVRETSEQRCKRGEGMSKHISGEGCKGPESGVRATARRPVWLAQSE